MSAEPLPSEPARSGAAIERELVIENAEGLHLRPIMQFVDVLSRFTAAVQVQCNGRQADGRSPMELLMLIATRGARLKLIAEGADATQALDAIADLIHGGFGES